MKLAIEGMDGVGKTTIAKRIAEDNKLIYIDKPLHYFFEDSAEEGYRDLMLLVNRIYDVKDPVIRSWFFGLGNLFCFRNFKYEDFIVDRHFVSNYFWNGDEQSDKVFESMINIIGVPDLTIVLYASPKVRMDRIIKRNPYDKDICDPEKQVDGYPKMISFLQQFQIPYILVDTEYKTIDDVVAEINNAIAKINSINKPYVKKLGM